LKAESENSLKGTKEKRELNNEKLELKEIQDSPASVATR
jgi:hypothetical protein